MTHLDLLALIEEGLDNGRISPHLAAFIAADVLGVEALETDYIDVVRVDEVNAE